MEFTGFRKESLRPARTLKTYGSWCSARMQAVVSARMVRLDECTGEGMGETAASLVKTRMARPLMLAVGRLGDVPRMGIKGVRCALVAGSETTSHANTLASDLINWAVVFGKEDPLDRHDWCFALTGDAVLVKQKKSGNVRPQRSNPF